MSELKPPSFPARPRNGGPLDLAMKAGMYFGNDKELFHTHGFQPKYNGWRGMVHTPTGRMWNRYNHEFSTSLVQEFRQALAALKETPFEWLDIEALERRHQVATGCIIVLDWVTPAVQHQHRRALLEHYLGDAMVGSELLLRPDAYLVPEHNASIYDALMERNAELGCVFYEGVVSKQIKSDYPMQLNCATQQAPTWVKHRFTTL